MADAVPDAACAARSRRRPAAGRWLPLLIVEAHGGALTVESELGAGTTFVVSLPATCSIPT